MKSKVKVLTEELNSGSLTVLGFELTTSRARAQNLNLCSSTSVASFMNKSGSVRARRQEREKEAEDETVRSRISALHRLFSIIIEAP